jgi:enoyl-CoA hydratase/carnithine racemase
VLDLVVRVEHELRPEVVDHVGDRRVVRVLESDLRRDALEHDSPQRTIAVDANAEAELVVDRRGPVLVARLNRPEARNALTPTLIGALGAALREGDADPEVRAAVLTGTGDRAFCAGMDLRAFASGGFDLADDENTDAYVRLLRGRIQIPVIGAANGTAVAGGLELLLG